MGGRAAYHKCIRVVVGEGCCHDRSRAESDKNSDEKLGFVEHEVERSWREVESTSDFRGYLS